MSTYTDFIASKRRAFDGNGLPNTTIPAQLFDWQVAITKWAIKKGRCALFADCGLGKSFMQLAWANNVPGRVLILAPLCVAEQTVAEGLKLGIDVVYAKAQPDAAGARIVITNYERIDGFHADQFAAVVLDESSILKAFDGKTRAKLIATFKQTPYRLCCTATPSPNDIAELANHAEFLGLMTRAEFLATWFVHDDSGWRMKGHAVQPFYRWLASWAVALRNPSDIGYSDEGFVLPPLTIEDHVVEGGDPGGMLFPELGLKGIMGRQKARRASVEDRVAEVVRLILKSVHDESGILPRMAAEESGLGEGISCGPGESCAATSMGEGEISNGQEFQRESYRASKSLRESEPSGQKEKQYAEVWPNTEAVRRDDGNPVPEVRNLWTPSFEQEAISVRGSLPQNEDSPGHSVCELQFRDREVYGQSGTPTESRVVSRKPQWVIWCGLNAEQDMIKKLLGNDCVSIEGKTPYNEKKSLLEMWLRGKVPYLTSKARVLGFGMNFQNCHHMAFVGVSDSYEQYYQMMRRSWRFGQKHPVDVHIVVSNSERAVVSNVRRKQAEADEMSRQIIAHMGGFEREELAS